MDRHPSLTARARGWHRIMSFVSGVFIPTTLVACGDNGGEGGTAGDYPLYEGAETLGSREGTAQEVSALQGRQPAFRPTAMVQLMKR